MKKLYVVLAILVATSGSVMAQGIGLQVADSAAAEKQGLVRATAGVTVGDEWKFIGGRLTYGVLNGLELFGDLGYMDLDEWDGGFSLQGGGIFAIPIELPFDVAIRGTIYKPFIDNVDIIGVSLCGVLSKSLSKSFSIYGDVGIDYNKTEVEYDIPGFGTISGDDTNTEIVFAAGVLFYIPNQDRFSVYAEVTYNDDFYVGAGARMDI
jgi:hypothetical protein